MFETFSRRMRTRMCLNFRTINPCSNRFKYSNHKSVFELVRGVRTFEFLQRQFTRFIRPGPPSLFLGRWWQLAISFRRGSLAGSASRKDKSFVLRRHPLRRREQPLEFVLSLNSKDSVGEIILAAGMFRCRTRRNFFWTRFGPLYTGCHRSFLFMPVLIEILSTSRARGSYIVHLVRSSSLSWRCPAIFTIQIENGEFVSMYLGDDESSRWVQLREGYVDRRANFH